MNQLTEYTEGECVSCGAHALEVAEFAEYYGAVARCRMCAYKGPWAYKESTKAIIETIIYCANVIRMDLKSR